jgi:hypothetical protein
MSEDDLFEFNSRPGKPRGQSGSRPRTFIGEVLRAVAEQGGDPRRVGRSGGQRKPTGRFNARGRGREAAAALEGHGGWEAASGEPWTGGMRYRARRVIVKARVVKLKGVESQAIAAPLRYLEREGVTTDGQHGQAYSGEEERSDTRAFIERGLEDRHQFRFIVAAEDGVALGDLKPFTRQLMRQHSAVDPDRQIGADAATWLDRQLVGRHRVETAPMGFGRQVEKALERRKETLIARNLAYRAHDGGIRYQPDLLATLQRRSWTGRANSLRPKASAALPTSQRATVPLSRASTAAPSR